MRKRNLHRGIAAAALSAPLVLGMTGVAAADEFEQTSNQAGPDGVGTSQTSASADANGDGQVSYEESHASAGPDGANSSSTESSAGDESSTDHESDGLLGLGLLG